MKQVLPAITLLILIGCAQPQISAEVIYDGDTHTEMRRISQEVVVDGLQRPWAVVWLPNGDMLITERAGELRLVDDGALRPEPVEGAPDVLALGQGGLLDVSLHPDFEDNNYIYFTYASGTRNANNTRLSRGVYRNGRVENLEEIFVVDQLKNRGAHFGSRITWLPDGTFLLTIGDGGNPPISIDGDFIRTQAQNRNSHLGKVLRLNDDGTPASGNPFASEGGAAAAVYSYGHRNIQGIDYDPFRDMIWVSEHGARGGDELNLVVSGSNYGWPNVSYSVEYATGQQIGSGVEAPGYVNPASVWRRTLAPSGLAVYDGDRIPSWHGRIFAGGLVSRDVRVFMADENGRVTKQESIPIGARVRDVRVGPDGYVYVLTDEAENGRLIRIGLE